MGIAIALVIGIIAMVLLFIFFNNYPNPLYFETYVSKWFPNLDKNSSNNSNYKRINNFR